MAGNMANVDKGIEYYLKACKLGHQETCKMLEEMRKPR